MPADRPGTADSSTPARELAIRLGQQELVAAFGVFALRARTLEPVFDQACAVAARGLVTRHAHLLAYRPASQDFLVRACVGWPPGVSGSAVFGADLASPAGYALRTKSPVVANDLGAERRFQPPRLFIDRGMQRAINAIVAEDGSQPYGVLEACGSGGMPFTQHDVAFVQSLANIVAAAIERQRRMAAQETLLREKDILMQEVHHRVKNSLQLVQTMLYLQARSVQDEGERSRLNDAAARIMSIASVHERLHAEGAVERVELGPYLDGLLTSICTSLGGGAPPLVDVAPMQLPAEHVTPIGLIAVELVTNALKYGAEPIQVSVVAIEGGIELAVRDAGKGFPPDFDPAATRSLGMRLIAAMARAPNPIRIGRDPSGSSVRVHVAFMRLTGAATDC